MPHGLQATDSKVSKIIFQTLSQPYPDTLPHLTRFVKGFLEKSSRDLPPDFQDDRGDVCPGLLKRALLNGIDFMGLSLN